MMCLETLTEFVRQTGCLSQQSDCSVSVNLISTDLYKGPHKRYFVSEYYISCYFMLETIVIPER